MFLHTVTEGLHDVVRIILVAEVSFFVLTCGLGCPKTGV